MENKIATFILGTLIIFAVLFFPSCHKQDTSEIQNTIESTKKVFNAKIKSLKYRLNLDEYNRLSSKKVETSKSLYFNKNAIIWENAKQVLKDKILYTQIPINENTQILRAQISFTASDTLKKVSVSNISQFLLIKEDKSTLKNNFFVITMICFTANTKSNNDCFNLTGFSGLIIYSDLNGNMKKSLVYKNGIFYKSQPVNKQSISSSGVFVKIYAKTASKATNEFTCEDCGYIQIVNKYFTGHCPLCGQWYLLIADCVFTDYTFEDIDWSWSSRGEGGGSIRDLISGDKGEDGEDGGGYFYKGGGNRGDEDESEQDTTSGYYFLNITVDGGGIATGANKYKKDAIAHASASPHFDYVFAGWSGDINSRSSSLDIPMTRNYNIKATFYSKLSECGKLTKAISNYDSLMKYRSLITDITEHGYIKSSNGNWIKGIETIGRGSLRLPQLNNTTEMVHTHELEIHLSKGDLVSIFRRFQRGDITDFENFKYTIVSPEYFIVVQIDDPNKMRELLNYSFIYKNSYGKYVLAEDYDTRYDRYLANSQHSSIEDYFKKFIQFLNSLNSGLKLSLHKIDFETGDDMSKFINSPQDVNDFLNKINNCIK